MRNVLPVYGNVGGTLVEATGGTRLRGRVAPRVCAVSGDIRHPPRRLRHASGAGPPPLPRHFPPVPLSRIAWLLTVAASLIVALLLLVSDYNGYALLAAAVGLS